MKITEENTTHIRVFKKTKLRLDQLSEKLSLSTPEVLSLIIGDLTEDTALSGCISKLSSIQQQHGFKTLLHTIQYLLSQRNNENQYKTASIEMIANTDTPFILTAPPRGFKTTFCKQLIQSKQYEGRPILVIDVNNEYTELQDIGYGFYNVPFSSFRDHIRYVPNQFSSQKSIEDLYEHLDRVKHTTKTLTIIQEESQTISDLSIFLKVLGSSRHFFSGFIACSPLSKISSFAGIEVIVPPPSPLMVQEGESQTSVNKALPIETLL